MKKVDAVIASRLGGMTSGDLADTVFTRDLFDAGNPPEEVADAIMDGDDIGRLWFTAYRTQLFGEVEG